MSVGAQDDNEHDGGGDPAPKFILVDHLVPGEGDEERAEGDDENAGKPRDVGVDRVEELGADDGVGCGPADTGQNVEDGDCTS